MAKKVTAERGIQVRKGQDTRVPSLHHTCDFHILMDLRAIKVIKKKQQLKSLNEQASIQDF